MGILENVVLSGNPQRIDFVSLIIDLLDYPLEDAMVIQTLRLLCNCMGDQNGLYDGDMVTCD